MEKTRKKIKIELISDDSARKVTFKKRTKGLLKKVSELSTLCEVEACVIVYAPGNPQPDVWPSPLEARRVLTCFKDVPELEKQKRMINQEGFLKERIAKMNEQLKRQLRENRKCEITKLMYESILGKGLHEVTADELCDLAWLVEEKMKEIRERKEELQKVISVASPQGVTGNGKAPSNTTPNIMERCM